MIYLTQLIYIKPGKEKVFHEFESQAIPLMNKYNGCILHRIRPTADSMIDGVGEAPYEIHFISFDTEADLAAFLKDETRKQFMHLKDESVRSILLVKGQKM